MAHFSNIRPLTNRRNLTMFSSTKLKGLTMAILLSFAFTAAASRPANLNALGEPSYSNRLAIDGIYLVKKTQVVAPEGVEWRGEYSTTDGHEEFQLNKNEAVHVRFLENGQVRLTYLTSEAEADVPNTLILSQAEFQQLHLNFVT